MPCIVVEDHAGDFITESNCVSSDPCRFDEIAKPELMVHRAQPTISIAQIEWSSSTEKDSGILPKILKQASREPLAHIDHGVP